MITIPTITISSIIGLILTVFIFNNDYLKQKLTDLLFDRLSTGDYNSADDVKSVLMSMSFKVKNTLYTNPVKNKLFHYYSETVLSNIEEFVDTLNSSKEKSTKKTKTLIKTEMYNTLTKINDTIEQRISMSDELQHKFDNFKNYLITQHTHAIENAMLVNNKKIIMMKVYDAIKHNATWFTFHTTQMFNEFNGHFENLKDEDVFKY